MSKSLRVLVACEFSQVVASAFIRLGHDAFSCDLQDCIGPYPDRHIKGDVFTVINDGWDLVIAHPPCTYLAHSGETYFHLSRAGSFSRWESRLSAARFFLSLYNAPCDFVCVENPVGFMNSPGVFMPPTQIIQPYQFGDNVQKRTCLWLRGLPKLEYYHPIKCTSLYLSRSGRVHSVWEKSTLALSSDERRNARSVFFPGVASAMASQWSDFVLWKKYGVPRSFPNMQMEFDFIPQNC